MCNIFTYDCTVHVQFVYSSCTVQGRAKADRVQFMYSLCTVHVQFMYSSFMTKIILKKKNKPVHLANSNDKLKT